jgi:hypothetical protein
MLQLRQTVSVATKIFHPNLPKLASVLLNVLFVLPVRSRYWELSAQIAEESLLFVLAVPHQNSTSIPLLRSGYINRQAVEKPPNIRSSGRDETAARFLLSWGPRLSPKT